MAFPDRKKLAEELGAGGVPPGADPQAAGIPAPPEAGDVLPREADLEAAGEAAAAAGGAQGEQAGLVAGLPTEGGQAEGAGGLMPENLTPEQQEQLQAELAMAARRKLAGI